MEKMETKYTDIIIYASGVMALVMAIIIVILCRMQVHPSREPFDVLPVQKLSKFPLRRQVRPCMILPQRWDSTLGGKSVISFSLTSTVLERSVHSDCTVHVVLVMSTEGSHYY